MNERPHLQLIEGGARADVHTAPFGIAIEDRPAYSAWVARSPDDPEHAERFTAAYCGPYESAEGWAIDLVASMGVVPKLNAAVPEWFQRYLEINLGEIAADMERIGEIAIVPNPEGGIWVFDAKAK